MIALVVVSSVQFVLEAHQRTQIRMNIIVSVVVGLSLFSGVFCDEFTCDYIDPELGDCTCGSINPYTPSCTENQYKDSGLYCGWNPTCNHCVETTTEYVPTIAIYILYIFLDSLPVLIFVPLILFFNIDLASGPGHSLVFAYQALVALFHFSRYNQYNISCTNFLLSILSASGLPVLFNAPLEVFWRSPTLTHYSLGYVKVLIAGVLVAVSFFLTICTQCPFQCCRSPWAKLRRAVRNWRERHLPQRPVLTGMCSVAILMYGSLLEVSFRLLFRCESPDNICHCSGYNYFNVSYNVTFCCMHDHTASFQSLCWGSKQHLPYIIPAWIMVGVAVLLSLPFFYHPGVPALASYLTGGRVQLPRLHKLAPLFDVFQGVYKPKMQFFTGLHLLYRIALWSAAALSPNDDKISGFLSLSVIIFATHSLFQPFESRRHNYVETLLMVNVTLSAVALNYYYQFTSNTGFRSIQITLLIVIIVLPNLPLFCVIIYYTYKFIRRCCCSRRCEYHERQRQGEVEKDDDSYQGERWEPPQDYVGPLLN